MKKKSPSNRQLRKLMKDPKVNRKGKKDDGAHETVIGFCPYCRILSPTLTSVKGRFRTRYTIGCICKESNGKRISGHNREKVIRKWMEE